MLQHVACRSGLDGLTGVGHIAVHRQKDDLGGHAGISNLDGGLNSVQRRHADVGHDHIRSLCFGGSDKFPAIGDDTDHLKLGFEQTANSLGENLMIIGDQDASFIHA